MAKPYHIHDQNGIYFMTFVTVGWVDAFTRKAFRDILIESLVYYRKFKGLQLFAYVIMSNHMHVVWKAQNGDLSNLLRDYKKRTSRLILRKIETYEFERRKNWMNMVFRYHAKYNRRVLDRQFWTHYNRCIELSTNYMINQIIDYIHMNPVKAGIVRNVEDYIYSSASNFVSGKGLIEIDPI